MSDRVQVMRMIVYEGPREWVEDVVARSVVYKAFDTKFGDATITGTTIKMFPQIIKKEVSKNE